ncbi:MAG: hypothetical protein ACAH83_10520 [Alphaproteobacteria bacterium]
MQLNRLGNLEQESDLSDLDELERELEMELEDEQPDQPEPQQTAPQDPKAVKAPPPVMSATPQQNNGFVITTGRGKSISKFASGKSFGFFPDQPADAGTNKAETQQDRKRDPLLATVSLFDSKFVPRPRQKPANDSKPKLQATETVDVAKPEPQTPKSMRSRFARSTVEALLSVGALPLQLLIEIGRFRFAKEHRFNSLQRLERALAQGNEDAERFLSYHPGALKKKKEPEAAPPPPTPVPPGM